MAKQAAAEWRTYEVGALISEQALAFKGGDGYDEPQGDSELFEMRSISLFARAVQHQEMGSNIS